MEEGAADVLGEGEILPDVSGVDVVVEDAAEAAGFVAVGQEEVLVAPLLVGRVVAGPGAAVGVAVAGVLVGGVEGRGRPAGIPGPRGAWG